MLATARSSTRSPLKSPTTTHTGFAPTGKNVAGWKDPSPLPINTATLLDPSSATARSGTPSPLKSPTAIVIGFVPTGKSFRAKDTVWAAAGTGRSDETNRAAATTNDTLAELPVLSRASLGLGPLPCCAAPAHPTSIPTLFPNHPADSQEEARTDRGTDHYQAGNRTSRL